MTDLDDEPDLVPATDPSKLGKIWAAAYHVDFFDPTAIGARRGAVDRASKHAGQPGLVSQDQFVAWAQKAFGWDSNDLEKAAQAWTLAFSWCAITLVAA